MAKRGIFVSIRGLNWRGYLSLPILDDSNISHHTKHIRDTLSTIIYIYELTKNSCAYLYSEMSYLSCK
jgi:hypothetical protein